MIRAHVLHVDKWYIFLILYELIEVQIKSYFYSRQKYPSLQ